MTDALFPVLTAVIVGVVTGLLGLHRRRPTPLPAVGTGLRARLSALRADGAVDLVLLVPCGLAFALAVVLEARDTFGPHGLETLAALLAGPASWLALEELLVPLKRRGVPAGVTITLVVGCAVALVPIASLLTQPSSSLAHGARFTVVGTRLDGYPGLYQRTGPGPGYDTVDKKLGDGTLVVPVCVADGPPPRGHHSRRWLRLTNGRFVSALFVDVPRGREVLRACSAAELPKSK